MEPKIRIKGFYGEWGKKNITSIASLKAGKSIDTSQEIPYPSQGYYPCYGGNGLRGYVRDYTHEGTYSIIGRQGALCGNVKIVSGKFHATEHAVVVSPITPTDPYFLYNVLTKANINQYATGVAQPGISVQNVNKSLFVVLPKYDEQQALGSYFLHFDSLIQYTTKKIESLKQVKAAGLQSMFPQEEETTPRVRFKGFTGEWEKVLVGKMGTTYSGLSGKTKDDFGIGGARFVTFLNVLTNAIIDTSILEAVNVFEGEHQNEVRKGDLLFNTSSETPEEVGMCAVMDEDLTNVYLNSFCFGFRVTDENIYSTFIAYLMRSHIGRRIMSILAQGATRYNLSKNSFCKAELLLPKTKAEQQQIANYFASLDSQITLQTQRLEKLKQIKSACLDNMFV
ncbi:MAG: restriction endonuclease subunit S [Prevotella sp.]|nr:restriction endonuclease subunit S [Prevotella sp.]